MAFETLLVEREGTVVTVTLNRPKQLNAINRTMVRELDELAAGLQVEPPRGPAARGAGRRGGGGARGCRPPPGAGAAAPPGPPPPPPRGGAPASASRR